ncbi:hypothetical protein RSAG8_06732, partial [Rhizoctonia solani AG-8 WAC10335]
MFYKLGAPRFAKRYRYNLSFKTSSQPVADWSWVQPEAVRLGYRSTFSMRIPNLSIQNAAMMPHDGRTLVHIHKPVLHGPSHFVAPN